MHQKRASVIIIICMLGTACVELSALQLPIYAQKLMTIKGQGQGVLPGDVPTLFSFSSMNDSKPSLSGYFECFAVMPDGTTMYVKGNVTSLTIGDNQTIFLAGPATVMGFGAGIGTFNAIVTPDIQNKAVRELVLTTDVNGDGAQASLSDGSEGPFKEKVVKSTLQITS
jgi:hypothetical protein